MGYWSMTAKLEPDIAEHLCSPREMQTKRPQASFGWWASSCNPKDHWKRALLMKRLAAARLRNSSPLEACPMLHPSNQDYSHENFSCSGVCLRRSSHRRMPNDAYQQFKTKHERIAERRG